MKKAHFVIIGSLFALAALASIGAASSGTSEYPLPIPWEGELHSKKIKVTPYYAFPHGDVLETWEGTIVVKNPSGSCSCIERTAVTLVTDGEGSQPEYTETRKVIACPPVGAPAA